jgi:hypothetical protein
MKLNSQLTHCWIMKLKKKLIRKQNKKKRIELTYQTHDLGNETKITSYKVNKKITWVNPG